MLFLFFSYFCSVLKLLIMKKILILVLCSSLVFSSCDTYTGSGAYVGGSLGSILGSAIGGLSGGPRGSDMGTIIGMAGGAVVGAVVGNQADVQRQRDMEQYQKDKARRLHRRNSQTVGTDVQYGSDSSYNNDDSMYGYGSGSENVANSVDDSQIFDSSNSGDDRLYDFDGKDYTGDYSAQKPVTSMPTTTVDELGSQLSYSPNLEIVNARFVDANEDNSLNRNETCKLIFEIMNRGNSPVCDVVPTVIETTGNKHIFISPSIHVERINPGQGIRYTAMIKADNRLKDGMARFCVSVIHEGKAISKVNEFNIPTHRK